jgi:glycosyltransferase involved in cell wall biosynthesis
MRVILNGLESLKPRTGIGHYTRSLYEHLLPLAGDDLVFFPDPLTRRLLASALRPGAQKPGGSGGRARALRRCLRAGARLATHLGHRALRRAFRAFATRNGCDLYHEPNYIPWPCNAPAVATVHDLSVLLHPSWHPAQRVRYYEAHFFRGLERCRHLIADSETIKTELVGRLGVAPERVTAIHLGVRPVFRPLPAEEYLPVLHDLGLNPGYLLHVGTIEPRKNLLMLMRAYVDLPAALRERCPLVLIGGWGWRNEDVRAYFEGTARPAGVRHIGYVPEEALPAVYNGARALAFPSHYEGFGFPPLEMMACGGCVVASTSGSLREILPAPARLLPPDDLEGWREALRAVAADDDLRDEMRRGAAEYAGRFTWERCARETWGVYERATWKRLAA